MRSLTLTVKNKSLQRIDCSPLTPDNLAGKSASDIAALPLQCGNQKITVDSVFSIAGDDANNLVINNSGAKLDYIGRDLKSGRITVNGCAGSYLGFNMRKGNIAVNGNVEAFAASGLAGGLIQINGNVGDFLGAAIPGDKKGMKGGIVIVTGNAGDRVGDQMRRGIILIEGDVGSYCASRMLAGTIGVLGNVDEYLGFGMRRGTVLLKQEPKLHSTLQYCGAHTLPFLSLMYKSFKPLPTAFAKLSSNRVHRYAGDVANDGKGEILVIGPMREWEQNLLATSAKAPVSIAKRKAKTTHLKAVA